VGGAEGRQDKERQAHGRRVSNRVGETSVGSEASMRALVMSILRQAESRAFLRDFQHKIGTWSSDTRS